MANYGMKGFVALGRQSAWGAGPTAAASLNYVKALSENINVTLDRFETESVHNSFFRSDDTSGVQRIAGDIVFAANASSIGPVLFAAFGAVTESSITAAFKAHVFACATADVSSLNPLPPFTIIAARDAASQHVYTDANLSQLRIGTAPNQDVRFTTSWVAKGTQLQARTADGSVVFPSSPSAAFTFDTCSFQIGGVGFGDVLESFEMTLNNNLSGVPALNNTNLISRIVRDEAIHATMTATIAFENTVEYQRFLTQTETTFAVFMRRLNSFFVLINAPRLVYDAFPLSTPGRGRHTVGLTGQFRTPVGSSGPVTITLWNNQTGYGV